MPPPSPTQPQGWLHLGPYNLKKASQPPHPVLHLLKNGEKVETYENCTIEDASIHLVRFRNNCLFRRINISDSLCNNSQFMNSAIRGTILNHCILFDCTWDEKTTLKHCQTITAPLAFRRFPAEIRALIFEEAVEWDGKMPNLVVALRGDPQLYREALGRFSKKNEFIYAGPNAIIAAPRAAIERIESLSI